MNTATPLRFIAATRSYDGNTALLPGMTAALPQFVPFIGCIKPPGRRGALIVDSL